MPQSTFFFVSFHWLGKSLVYWYLIEVFSLAKLLLFWCDWFLLNDWLFVLCDSELMVVAVFRGAQI
ncbi:hypothetical protein [Bartonella rattaustraliani]|uniref:hypothetical protein n=1 Tax=Bartonella rattaustraliani TaxID=481139 RepID=UPI000363B4F6|nr:hypothetical protein [Bartonella rattaustraliani]